ncbi:T9SS type A sorting domain-containing protein [Dyadobacter sp. CY356]|uniref:T9SS type A sorting domain-containing protein n=1 Tax=Dyadobacter sp. CY356 TaxID=2906442 RepID=UPI001F24E81E|nr:T9SS type A sorting domain-containing protein [Dyadobacter sp. CY356]MCF0058298.1 T9SS type A sorting domain-containing protein [Dyadobacter sp. CY356]
MKHYCFILAFLFSVTVSSGQTLEDDRLALLSLYNSTNGAGWINKTGWNPGGPTGDSPCGWFGVTCKDNRVTELNLENNSLTGSLPADIGNLSALVSLNLKGNDPLWLQGAYLTISGTIPAQIGNLSNLEYLDLGGNKFSGSIPSSIGNLIKLTYLNINYVPVDVGFDPIGTLEGSFPSSLGNLVNLKYLDLSLQNLNGSIPDVFYNLTSLEYLNLAGNLLSGSIPPSFSQLSNITLLDLSYVTDFERGYDSKGLLGGTIPDLSAIPISASVYIRDNSFTFDGIEANISRLDSYYGQKNIPITETSGVLSVNAGGTVTNNTYKWYKDNQLVATNIGNESYTVTGAGTYKVIVTNSVAANLTLTSKNYEIPLPVTMVAFEGKNKSTITFLTWQTTSETTNKGFEIQRSKDAIIFENIGFIDGSGDSKVTNDYSFLDKNPLPLTYYRLKQIDYDGKFEYSRIIFVKKDNDRLSVYPNPVKEQLFVSGLEKEESIIMHNMEGRVVLEQKLRPLQPINTSNFSNGLYIIKVGEETRKIVIQN